MTSDHNVGIATGGFTSPEAMAKPIDAFLRHAHERYETWNEFLNENTKKKANRVGIHVSSELAGLGAGDTFGYRGAATSTLEMGRDWSAARQHVMHAGGSPVHAVPYDPSGDGVDPGVTLAFKRIKGQWHLVTCFPVDTQQPMNKRLEDIA